MSVTIHPADLYTNPSIRWEYDQYECICTQGIAPPSEDCFMCHGTGVDKFKRAPQGEEMQLSNGNWSTFGNALGILQHPDDYYGGSANPLEVLRLIYAFDESLAVRAPSEEGGPGTGKCRMIDMGLPPEAVESYIPRLKEICFRALVRGVDIEWA